VFFFFKVKKLYLDNRDNGMVEYKCRFVCYCNIREKCVYES